MSDQAPVCFEAATGEFDVGAVEAFFASRRAQILDPKAEPLKPLHSYPPTVQARWRHYLAEKAAKQRPMNGVAASSGKLDQARYAAGTAAIGAPAWAGKYTQGPHIVVTEPVTMTENVTKIGNKEAPVTADVTAQVTASRLLTSAEKHLVVETTRSAPLTPAEKQARYRERKKLTEADIRRALEGKPLP